jgi:uncharacterized membrane protein
MSRWLWLMLASAILALGFSLAVWFGREAWLPDRVPVHWGITNQPDKWVERDGMFWWLMIAPLMMFGFTGMALALPWLSPKNFSIEPFRATYGYIMGVIGVMFLYLHVVTIAAQVGWLSDLPRVLVGGMLLFMAALGNVLGKVRRNFWVGVKTPWTLASEVVWNRTHRLAGWLFVGGSLLGFVLILVGVHPLAAFAPFLVAAIFPVFYSLWLYKKLQREGRLEEAEPRG